MTTNWTCEDITEDLCQHLSVENGFVQLDQFNSVSFWRYYLAPSDDDDDTILQQDKSQDDTIPLVVIPGGPGWWPHDYLLPLKQQACRGRYVYFYNPTVNVTLAPDLGFHANTELPTLIEKWGLSSFSLLGHGIGGSIALMYATQIKPTELESLVLLSVPSDMQLYYDAQWDETDGTFGTLPSFVQEQIHSFIHQEAFAAEIYQELVRAQYPSWLTRTWPVVDCLAATLQKSNTSPYRKMTVSLLGEPHAFMLDISQASLANFDLSDDLRDLKDYPILVVSGEFDAVRPKVVDAMVGNLPIAIERHTIARSGHLTMIDQPKAVNDIVGDFLDHVDRGYHVHQLPRNDNPSFQSWCIITISLLTPLVFMLLVFMLRRTKKQHHVGYEPVN